jgi:glycosyltransferase involved in cell wall biosynthesis
LKAGTILKNVDKLPDKNRRYLVIYNLETDLDSLVLASAHEWIAQFSKMYSKVFVYSTHIGKIELPENIVVKEIGGGTLYKKMIGTIRLYSTLHKIYKFRGNIEVFHHMSSHTLLLLGFPIKIMKVPQIIWYSHSKLDLFLKFGRYFADKIVSSTLESSPMKEKKSFMAIGHGVNLDKFKPIDELVQSKRSNLIHVGRIAPIKNIEYLLEDIFQRNKNSTNLVNELFLLGPVTDANYFSQLEDYANERSIKLIHLGALPNHKIPYLLEKFSMFYSGTPLSADKAAIEAGISGCILITKNESVMKLTGMSEIWKSEAMKASLSNQIDWVLNQPTEKIKRIRKRIMKKSRQLNDLTILIEKIYEIFGSIREGKG